MLASVPSFRLGASPGVSPTPRPLQIGMAAPFFIMLRDLDLLMRSRRIDAILVPMHEAMHPSFRWITRGAKVTRGYAIKRLDHEPVLITLSDGA